MKHHLAMPVGSGGPTLPPALNQHHSYLGKGDLRLSETIMLMSLSPAG